MEYHTPVCPRCQKREMDSAGQGAEWVCPWCGAYFDQRPAVLVPSQSTPPVPDAERRLELSQRCQDGRRRHWDEEPGDRGWIADVAQQRHNRFM